MPLSHNALCNYIIAEKQSHFNAAALNGNGQEEILSKHEEDYFKKPEGCGYI